MVGDASMELAGGAAEEPLAVSAEADSDGPGGRVGRTGLNLEVLGRLDAELDVCSGAILSLTIFRLRRSHCCHPGSRQPAKLQMDGQAKGTSRDLECSSAMNDIQLCVRVSNEFSNSMGQKALSSDSNLCCR